MRASDLTGKTEPEKQGLKSRQIQRILNLLLEANLKQLDKIVEEAHRQRKQRMA